MKKSTGISLLALFLFALSCSDDTSTNPTSEQESFYFPLAIGNEWEFDFYWLDESYEASGDSLHTDKSTIINNLNYRGKDAYQLDEDMLFNISYLSVDDNAIYGHVEYEDLSSDGKTYYPDEWMTIYNLEKDNWQVYHKEINKVEGDVTFKGSITLSGTKLGMKNIDIDGRNLDIYEFQLIQVAKETMIVNGESTSREELDTNYVAIVDSIGIYYYKSHDYPTEKDPDSYGWISKVGKYTIK